MPTHFHSNIPLNIEAHNEVHMGTPTQTQDNVIWQCRNQILLQYDVILNASFPPLCFFLSLDFVLSFGGIISSLVSVIAALLRKGILCCVIMANVWILKTQVHYHNFSGSANCQTLHYKEIHINKG